jgi:ectoine hydroxylase
MSTLAAPVLDEISYQNTAQLTETERLQFEYNGFLVYENVLTVSEINIYRKLIAEQKVKTKTFLYGDKAGQPRNAEELLELRNAVAYHPELMELMTHPKIFPLIVDLMGPHISLITSHMFSRPPTKEALSTFKQIDWHRDGPAKGGISFNGKFPWLYTKVGIFLTDLMVENAGSLRVIPGSHLNDKNLQYCKNKKDPIGTYEIRVPAGSVVVFDNRVLHAVGPNYSDVSRENIYFGYGWRYIKPIDYVSQSEQLLNDCTPIQKQLFGQKKSELGFYIPQEEDVPLVEWQNNRLKG